MQKRALAAVHVIPSGQVVEACAVERDIGPFRRMQGHIRARLGGQDFAPECREIRRRKKIWPAKRRKDQLRPRPISIASTAMPRAGAPAQRHKVFNAIYAAQKTPSRRPRQPPAGPAHRSGRKAWRATGNAVRQREARFAQATPCGTAPHRAGSTCQVPGFPGRSRPDI